MLTIIEDKPKLVLGAEKWQAAPFRFLDNLQVFNDIPSWQDIILSGNTALTLVNAKENGLNYLKLFGGCEQNGTPTPDTPIDIVSNNGVLKLSPNLVDFNEIRINRTTWASADKTKGFEVNADVYNKSVGDQLFTNANCFGVFVPAKINESVSLEFFDYSPDYTRCYYCEVTADGKCNTAPVSFASDGAISQQTFTLTQADSIGFVFEWYIHGAQVRNYTKENYMIVRGATPPTAYMPYGQIYTDGTVETINVHGKNLFDGAIELGSINPADGSLVVDNDRTRSANFISVQPNTTYTFTRENSSGIRWIVGYDKDKNGITDGMKNQPAAITNLIPDIMSKTFTTTPTTHYIKWYNTSSAGLNEKVQIELGSTATDYEPYYNGGTATAEMLLKVDDYQDVQSIIDGSITRNVGVKVLDGTENWTNPFNNGRFILLFPSAARYGAGASVNLYCSHFEAKVSAAISLVLGCGFYANTLNDPPQLRMTYPDMPMLSDFKQYLADQYNAGTPVIIVYPLAEPTTESVTPQPLSIQAGTNIVSITQASIDNLELEVSYKGTV